MSFDSRTTCWSIPDTQRVLVVGKGKMGDLVAAEVERRPGWQLMGQVARDGKAFVADLDTEPTVIIDFSAPAAMGWIVPYVSETRVPLVSGTHGLTSRQLLSLERLGTRVCWSPSYSRALAVMARACSLAGPHLLPDYGCKVMRHAPADEADGGVGAEGKALADAVDPIHRLRHVDGSDASASSETGDESTHDLQMGFVATTGGTVGYEVRFADDEESLALVSAASGRSVYARGALDAAVRLQRRPSGFYSYQELIFES